MRRLVTAAILVVATVFASLTPTLGQPLTNFVPPPPPATSTTPITPLGFYVIGAFGCAAAAPIAQTIILRRELTMNEAYRTTFGCFGGPLGWVIADWLAPPTVALPPGTSPPPPKGRHSQGPGRTGGNVSIPPAGFTAMLPDEILIRFGPGVSAQTIARIASAAQITQLETQTFTLTGQTLQRWRITGGRTARQTLQILARYNVTAQPNYLYRLQQSSAPANANAGSDQYVVSKLRLNDVHQITNGDDVLVAVIDSKIDGTHPDLAGVIADQVDFVGAPGPAHAHGTAMAGAIAAHSKLIGVAPKVKLLAIRAFSGSGDSAQATTFNILKGLDWAASKNARIINMSFAGPADTMLREMLSKANAHGMVLIAAVGNAGPRSPPLFPAADAHVIGITATDVEDKLMPQANRGAQVAVAAPGVEILAAAPDGAYQITSGTSVAAAHASGVAALLLARNGNLTPAQVRSTLIRTAHPISGSRNDYGAGVIDALSAVNSLPR